MATIIQLKRSSSGNAPNTAILAEAELAYSQDRSADGANAILYIESIDSGSNPVVHKVGGKYYTDIVDTATSSATANKLVKRDGNGSFSANVVTSNDVVTTNVRSAGNTTKVVMSDIGIVAIDIGGVQTKFLASGVEVSGNVFGGSFGGNKLSLTGGSADLISDRNDSVRIITGTGGNSGNTWQFSNAKLTLPLYGDIFDSVGVSVIGRPFNQANVAFAQANVAFAQANVAFAGANIAYDIANKAIANVLSGTGIVISGHGASQPNVTVTLGNTSVNAGSYGGQVNGVSLVVDAQGRITSATNTSMSSNLTLTGNDGTDTLTIGIESLTVVGSGGGISTTVTDNVISIVNTGVKNVDVGVGLSTDLNTGNITLTNTGVRALTSAGHGIVFDVATGNITATFTGVGNITGTANEIEVNQGSGNVTIGLPNNVTVGNDLTVSGNLYVLGDAVNINTSTITIEDPLVKFGNVTNPSDSLSIGFYGQYTSSGAKYAGLYRDHADNGVFKLFKDLATDPTTNVVAEANFTLATLKSNLTGGNITSLVNAIAVDSGGTGRKTLTANAVLYGDGTNAVALATGSAGQVLQLTDTGMVAFGSIDGGTF